MNKTTCFNACLVMNLEKFKKIILYRKNSFLIKKLLIILLLLNISSIFLYAEQSINNSDRTKVATIGKRVIYFDEIKAEERLLDTFNALELEKTLLKAIIKNEVFKDSIASYGIKPTKEEIESVATLMFEREWEMLGPTEETKHKSIKIIRYKMSKIYEGLNIWKKDAKLGDLFAKRELEPLGINSYIWNWYTSKSNDLEFFKKVENYTKYDKEIFKKELFVRAKRSTEMEQLKNAVLHNIQVADEEVLRLFEITENIAFIDVVTLSDSIKALEKVRRKLKKKDVKELERIKRYRKLHLTGSDLKLNETNRWYNNNLFLLAMNCESIVTGVTSNIFECNTSNGKSICLFFILECKTNDNIKEISKDVKLNLIKQIEDYKRENEFKSWFSEKMEKETIIHLEQYQDIFDN